MAGAPLPREYRRHEPEGTILYQVVQQHLLSFLADARANSDDGRGYPWFVERELHEYLRCGILAHGFARVHCDGCGDDLLVAFSCKRRDLCPSCAARRMLDTAAHLVDRVLPYVPMRQWVLTFPHRVRFVLARHPALLSAALTFFVRTVFALQRSRARQRGLPTTRARTSGAVTFVQRFGSALQLTPHFHTLVPDGVFVEELTGDNDRRRFVKIEPPDDAEVEWVLARVARRVDKLLAAGGMDGVPGEPQADEPTDLLSQTLSRAAAPPPKLHQGPAPIRLPDRRPRTAAYEGFSLHADVAVHENDRQGLERLCRYGLRPPLAPERLTRIDDGRLRYRMKRTFSDGTRELLLEPTELLRRLCALIPPPRVHMTRYHGIFAPNACGRRAVTRQGPSRRPRPAALAPVEAAPGSIHPSIAALQHPCGLSTDNPSPAAPAPAPAPTPGELGTPPSYPLRQRYLPWAELLRRVHEIEVLRCNRCQGGRRVIAFITDAAVVAAILAHLGLPTQPPPLAAARAPPQQELPLDRWPDEEFVDPPAGDPT